MLLYHLIITEIEKYFIRAETINAWEIKQSIWYIQAQFLLHETSTLLLYIFLFRFNPLCLLQLKNKGSMPSNTTLQFYTTMCYMFRFIRTIIRHLY